MQYTLGADPVSLSADPAQYAGEAQAAAAQGLEAFMTQLATIAFGVKMFVANASKQAEPQKFWTSEVMQGWLNRLARFSAYMSAGATSLTPAAIMAHAKWASIKASSELIDQYAPQFAQYDVRQADATRDLMARKRILLSEGKIDDPLFSPDEREFYKREAQAGKLIGYATTSTEAQSYAAAVPAAPGGMMKKVAIAAGVAVAAYLLLK